jgi:hypothetical protein
MFYKETNVFPFMSSILGNPQSTPFSEHLLKAVRRGSKITNLNDQILVDIGAGKTPYGYGFACSTGAREYIGIELYHAKELSDRIKRAQNNDDWYHPESLTRAPKMKGIPSIPYTIISMDMKEALETFPDNSVSVLASGIDDIIIPRKRLVAIEYQVKRVLHKNGFFINNWSDIEPMGLLQKKIMNQTTIYKKRKEKEQTI